jgi:hypothetical protein
MFTIIGQSGNFHTFSSGLECDSYYANPATTKATLGGMG